MSAIQSTTAKDVNAISITFEAIQTGNPSIWRQVNAFLSQSQKITVTKTFTRLKSGVVKVRTVTSIPNLRDSVTGVELTWNPVAAFTNAAKVTSVFKEDKTDFMSDDLAEGTRGQNALTLAGNLAVSMVAVDDARLSPY